MNGNVVDQHVIIVFSIGDAIIHLMILKYTRLNMFDLNIIIKKKEKLKLKKKTKNKKQNVKNNTIIKNKTIHTKREDKQYY